MQDLCHQPYGHLLEDARAAAAFRAALPRAAAPRQAPSVARRKGRGWPGLGLRAWGIGRGI